MKKNKRKQASSLPILNSVAKYAHYFNKSVTFKDKTKYQRKAKHKHSSLSLCSACSA